VDLPPEEGTPAAEKPSYKNILKDKKKKEKRRRNKMQTLPLSFSARIQR
jgi:hypothetical protein